MTITRIRRSMQFLFVAALTLSAATTALAQQNLLNHPDVKLITFDVPGAQGTVPQAIAPSGEIVGYYTDTDGEEHGFIRKANGTIETLTVPNSVLTAATGVNAFGE